MTPGEMADVLSAIGVYDGRKISQADVAAWHAAAGDLDRSDALAAVVRHHANSTDWMKPAHLRREVLAIRNERADRKHHEIRELPSRFERDEVRARRLAEGVRRIAEHWTAPSADAPDTPHEIALQRARRERGNRPIPTTLTAKRSGGKPLVLDKVEGPEWAKPEVRERIAVANLHAAGRPCGRQACPRCSTDKEPS